MDASRAARYVANTDKNLRPQASRRTQIGIVGIVFAAVTTVVVQSFASAGPPPTLGTPEIVSRRPLDNQPSELDSNVPTMSAIGDIITFQMNAPIIIGFNGAPDRAGVAYRERPDGVSVWADPVVAFNATVSDDGCVIGYSGPSAPATTAVFRELRTFNRCTNVRTTVATAVGVAVPRPGLNADGSRVFFINAGSIGTVINVFGVSGGTSTLLASIPPPEPGFRISEVVASDDGNTVAFVAGPDNDANGLIDFAQSNVYLFDLVNETYALASIGFDGAEPFPLGESREVSISGDGTLVAFSRNMPWLYDRNVNNSRPLFSVGSDPSISNDGRSLVFRFFAGDNSDVALIRTNDRWASFAGTEIITTPRPDAPSSFRSNFHPVISAHGRWVAWATGTPTVYVSDPAIDATAADQVLVRERRPTLAVDSIDFGVASAPVVQPATVRNTGISGWRVTSIATSGAPFSVDSHTCPSVLHPDDTCVVQVRYTPAGNSEQIGQLVVRDDSYPGIPLQASGRLRGVPDITTTTTTLPDGTTTTTTTRITTGTTTTTTTTPPIVVPDLGLAIEPDPVSFVGSTVGAPAPSRIATVTNTGDVAVTVQTVSFAGPHAADFSVILDGCTGLELAPAATCALTVGFVPGDAGPRTANLSVFGTGSTSASTRLEGSGAFDAQLVVTPEVAAPGQVVTVAGSGFPGSTVVSVTLGTDAPIAITTDGTGGFMMPWLILGGTPQGELEADDVAVAGRYDAEAAPLLVVGIPMRPQSTATRNRNARSHVSR